MKPAAFYVAAAAAFLIGTSPPAGAMTMQEALSAALRTNPSMNAARQAVRTTHEGVPLALSAWLPTVRVGISNEVIRDKTVNGSRRGDSRQRRLELTYRQNLYRSGHSTATLRQAVQNVHRDHAAIEDEERSLLLRVATTYLDVLHIGRVVRLREASMAAFEERLRESERQFNVGDRTRADLAQAVAEKQNAAADVASAKADLEVQRSRFAMLVGTVPDELEAAGIPDGLPTTLEAARRAAREEHPLVYAAEHAVRAAEHAVRAASAELGPRVDLLGTLSRTTFHGTPWYHGTAWTGTPFLLPDSTDLVVELHLTLPLYQAGGAGARLRQAILTRGQRRNEWLAVRRDAEQQVTDAWASLVSTRQRQQAFVAAVEASEEALDGIRREAELGGRTTREVLDAERQLVLSRIRALSAERDIVINAYRLLSAVGRLTARRLEIGGVPDLVSEATDTRWNILPGVFSLGEDDRH